MIDIAIVLYKPGNLEKRLLSEVQGLTTSKHSLRVFDNSQNQKSVSAAYNELLEKGAFKYVAIMHSDICLTRGWEKPLIKILESRPDVGIANANPRTRGGVIEKNFSLGTPPGRDEIEQWAKWCREKTKAKWITHAVPAGDGATLHCAMMRRKDWDGLKGFDERLRFYGRGIELQERFMKEGLKTLTVIPSAVWHKDGASFYRAVGAKALHESEESRHWNAWRNRFKTGEAKPWHKVDSRMRAKIRRNPEFRVR